MRTNPFQGVRLRFGLRSLLIIVAIICVGTVGIKYFHSGKTCRHTINVLKYKIAGVTYVGLFHMCSFTDRSGSYVEFFEIEGDREPWKMIKLQYVNDRRHQPLKEVIITPPDSTGNLKLATERLAVLSKHINLSKRVENMMAAKSAGESHSMANDREIEFDEERYECYKKSYNFK